MNIIEMRDKDTGIFLGFQFIVPKNKITKAMTCVTPPPPPPFLVGDADVSHKPALCCSNFANGNGCYNKGKYVTHIDSNKWFCGLHLKTQYRKYEYKKGFVSKTEQCSICYEDILLKDNNMTKTACNHAFHTECLNTWTKVKQNCPMCRKSLLENDKAVNHLIIYNLYLVTKALQTNTPILPQHLLKYFDDQFEKSEKLQKEFRLLESIRKDNLIKLLIKIIDGINYHPELKIVLTQKA